jgi:hypothetical protein
MIEIIKIADTICIMTYGTLKFVKYINKCGLTVCFERIELEGEQD